MSSKNYSKQIFLQNIFLHKISKKIYKKILRGKHQKDADSQLIKYPKQINRQFKISNQKLCTWVNQGGYRRYRQGLCPYDG